MLHLAPYQSGLWLAEYLNTRCQLCHLYPSSSQAVQASQVSSSVDHPLSHSSAQRSSLSLWGARMSKALNSGLLCSSCHESINWLPAVFYVDIAASTSMAIQAASYYDYPIRQAIIAFKQYEDLSKLPLLVHAIRQLPRPLGCHATNSVIVPMPTTSSRLVKRGFDPVTILSAYLSKHWQIPRWHGVHRIDNTVSQQGLSRAERLTNLDHAFMLIKPPTVRRLLLFDDVATTGASLQALAQTLHYYLTPTEVHSSVPPDSLPTAAKNLQISAYAIAHGHHQY